MPEDLVYSKVLDPNDYKNFNEHIHIEKIHNILQAKKAKSRYEHPHRKWEYGLAMNVIKKTKARSVLDVGGGGSVFAPSLAKVGIPVIVVDPGDFRTWVEKQSQIFRTPISYITENFFDYNEQKKFDSVTCLSVIEHVPEHIKFFKKLLSYVKEGGTLFLTMDFHPSGEKIIGGHIRTYNKESIDVFIEIAKEEGFEVFGETNYSYGENHVNNYNFASLALINKNKKHEKVETIYIGIPTYGLYSFLKNTVDSLVSNKHNIKLLVVDNGSDIKTKEVIKSFDCDIITNEENLGVSKAWNQILDWGTSHDDCNAVFILNNDIVLKETVLDLLYEDIVEFGFDGISGHSLRNDKKSFDAFSFPLTDRRFGRAVNFSCFGLSLSTIKNIGKFDEAYFCYVEDADYHWRMMKAGLLSGVDKSAPFLHYKSSTIVNTKVSGRHGGGKRYFQKKWGFPPKQRNKEIVK